MNKAPTYSLKAFPYLLRRAFAELSKNDPLRMAGATAFFTTFALPPIIVILIQTLGLFFNPEKISEQLFRHISTIVGTDTVQQVVNTLITFRKMAQHWYATVLGFLFLLFVATTLFKVIKSSLNQVWKLRVVQKRTVWVKMHTRIRAIVVIMVAGILFTIGLIAESAQAFLGNYIFSISPLVAVYFNSALNYLLSVIIVTLWFAIVFRYLPDGRPQWKTALAGGLLTSLLFNVGKLVIRFLLKFSNIQTIYGASGSIVLLLLFVFYSSLILYFGAAFTKVWSEYYKQPIHPSSHAMHYEVALTDE